MTQRLRIRKAAHNYNRDELRMPLLAARKRVRVTRF